jgi:drug/metabolite transporter (DMT)-like permease
MENEALGIVAALGSSAAWALGAVLFRKLGDDLSPLPMAFAKAAISSVLLAAVAVPMGIQPMRADVFWVLALSGVLGIGVGDACFFAALRSLGAHLVVLLMMLTPVFTIGLAVVFLNERPDAVAWLGIAITLAGVGLMVVGEAPSESSKCRWSGFGWGIAAVVCTAVATVTSAHAVREVPALDATLVRMGAGMVSLGGFALVAGRTRSWVTELSHLRLGFRLAIAVAVVTFGGFFLSLVALKHASVSVANTLNSLEPLFVLPLAVFVLKERPRATSVLGAVAACAGVAVLCLGGSVTQH